MKKIKSIITGLLCAITLSTCVLSSAPIQSSAHSIPVKVQLFTNTGSTYKTVYATETKNYYTVNTAVLNVRKTASTKYAPIKQLKKGEKVQVVRTSGDWVEIKTIHKKNDFYITSSYKSDTGKMWVNKAYLKKATSTIHLIPLAEGTYRCV